MIKSFWVINQNGEQLDLNLRSSGDELGLLVVNVTGLGSPKATVNGTGGPNFDGVRVNSVVSDSRHIVLTLAVTGQGAKEEAGRALVYKFFPSKQYITFGVTTDTMNVYIPAYVEQNDMNHFAKVVNATISLLGNKPYFVDLSTRVYSIGYGSGTKLFSFPFSNESLLIPLIEYGKFYSSEPSATIDYNNGVSTGCEIKIYFSDDPHGTITITNTNGSQSMVFDTAKLTTMLGSDLEAGDQLHINTKLGEKKITFIRGGYIYNVTYIVGIDSAWLKIHPGKNIILIGSQAGGDIFSADITFNPLRDGI